MRPTDLCIRRPVTTTLLTGAALLWSILGNLGAASADEVPTVEVIVSYPGASVETMAVSVAAPLERQFATIAGVASISSATTLGRTTVTVEFDENRTRNAAAIELQSAISAASSSLPHDLPTPPTVVRGGDH
jgi:HAE1 family hydrophobic/amphiphilic exporter-1